jgi:hypothetical protein
MKRVATRARPVPSGLKSTGPERLCDSVVSCRAPSLACEPSQLLNFARSKPAAALRRCHAVHPGLHLCPELFDRAAR